MFEKIIMNKLNTILKIWNYFQGFSNSAGKYIPSSNPCYTVVAWFFFPFIAGNCPSFAFLAIAGMFLRLNLGIVPGSAWEFSQLFIM